MKKIVIITLAIILLVIIGVCIISITPVSNNTEEKEIVIPMGSTANEIIEILKENNLIRSKIAFKVYVKINNISNFKAGTYYLKENMSIKEIIEIMQNGKVYGPTITYLEGKPMWWLAETIAQKTNNTKEDVYKVLADEAYRDTLIEKYWFLTDEIKNKNIYYSLEGYLFPDTYLLSNKDASVEEIFEMMLDRMEEMLGKYKISETKNEYYTIHQIITIASILEAEGTNYQDKQNIASVIYNRLNEGMPLQCDTTTYYSVKIDMGERDLYQSEINTENPYNTRGSNMEGRLPIGPISSVGIESIKAAVNPTDTNYLFFSADKNGKVYFAQTNSEHEQIITDLQNKGLWFNY